MLRSLRHSLLALGLLSIAPTGSRAGGPAAVTSTTPAVIRLVGASGVTPDATAGQFTVVARDLANNPMNGCSIVLDLSNCPDLAICSDQMDANALVNCAAKTVRKFTNALGQVTFTVLGSSTGAGSAASLANGGRIFGNGRLLGMPSVSAFDLDGSGGVGAGDLSVWLSDFGSGVAYQRSDFDGSGTIGAADLSAWLAVFGAGGSAQSCGASCP
jgi:pimeloyl-ACP methyl ester carboxylesterase